MCISQGKINDEWVSIGTGDGLAMNRWQAIIWTH